MTSVSDRKSFSPDDENRTITRLRAILDEAVVLLNMTDRDVLLRHAVEFAREKLGAERCGIFLSDEQADMLQGTFGTDEHGETTDERSARLPKDSGAWAALQEHVNSGRFDRITFDWRYTFFKKGFHVLPRIGWVVATPISVARDNRLTGVMYNDSAITGAPLDEIQQELLAVFCSLLGNILDRKRAEEERRRIEVQMQHTQKLESLGILAGGIAHDFNNLLAAILGNADLALAEMPQDSQGRGCVEEIVKVSRQAAELCRQLLAYSGKGRFVVEPFDLSKAVEEMAPMLQMSMGQRASIRYNIAPDLPCVKGDAAQIKQVVMNLIINAAEAMGDQGGVIAVSTGLTDCDHRSLAGLYLGEGLPEGRYVFLEVTDTGCGMDEPTMRRVFDPFFTTKFTGRGLGLAAVAGIVRGHLGAIGIHSEPGKGSTFRVLFPAGENVAPGRQSPPLGGARDAEPGSGKILVVDDEESVRLITQRMLQFAGYAVVTAADGREAVAKFKHQKELIAGVLLDLTMPGCDGKETYRLLRDIDPNVRVVLTSGYNEQDATERLMGQELAGFLKKPFRLDELLTMIRTLFVRQPDESDRAGAQPGPGQSGGA